MPDWRCSKCGYTAFGELKPLSGNCNRGGAHSWYHLPSPFKTAKPHNRPVSHARSPAKPLGIGGTILLIIALAIFYYTGNDNAVVTKDADDYIADEDFRYYPEAVNVNNELRHPAFVDKTTYRKINALAKNVATEMEYGDISYMRTGENETRYGLPDVIDCDDYADNLARRSRQAGYDVRIVVCTYKIDGTGHAMNALVLSNGNAVLMEPQQQEQGKSVFDDGPWFDSYTNFQIGAYNKTMAESNWQ
jgi:rubredoxin